ncbi:chorismate mutase [Xanthovirga aplysinae]|uniref:chorismate mutase n=1 Tax=Xanthovirga aplysinae TaxID=2529853 RepID=UPI0012BCBD97|nr:chorismate mutase [Xanthovirga aplysinae]MTI33333.1 3-deoxy-7-phosphoheptulonate synthase [Xanthovirga aplysinae]
MELNLEKLKLTKKNKKLIISGPCSAESEEQVLNTALQLAETGQVDVLRAGIWKPRTRPNSFEGIGTIGLNWMQKAKAVTGLPIAVEIANAKHAEEALKYGVDLLWIGARTTVNPFAVQEIADALRGTEANVLVKNPINPDLELWIGGIERIYKAGIRNLGAIHRGFSKFGNSIYRNIPLWQIAQELKERIPDLPIIGDPSHMAGNRELIKPISKKSLELDYDGLMIESHINPDNAWSDAKQQITPKTLSQLLTSLDINRNEEKIQEDELTDLRQQINHIDEELIELISNRMKVAASIGHYKKQNNLNVVQNDRWHEVLDRVIKRGEKGGLRKDFVEKYLTIIHEESINHQVQV